MFQAYKGMQTTNMSAECYPKVEPSTKGDTIGFERELPTWYQYDLWISLEHHSYITWIQVSK